MQRGSWCPEAAHWASCAYLFHKVWVDGVHEKCTEAALLRLLRQKCRSVQGVLLHRSGKQATAYVWSHKDVETVTSHTNSIFFEDQALQLDRWVSQAQLKPSARSGETTPTTCASESDLQELLTSPGPVNVAQPKSPSRPRRPWRTRGRKNRFVLRSHRRLTQKSLLLERQAASYAERCHAAEQREHKALQEKEMMARTCTKILAKVEAEAEALLTKAQMQVPDRIEHVRGSDWASCFQGFEAQFRRYATILSTFVRQTLRAKQVLSKALCCTLSLDVFRRPMLAPDGQVYEKHHILTWLGVQPISPLTRQPMRPEDLLYDRVVHQATAALWLLQGEDPAAVEEKALQELGPPLRQPDLRGLHEVITARDKARALDLLQQPGEVVGLNDLHGDEKATLLHLALLHDLPEVAVAIVKHPAFRRQQARMGTPHRVITPMHLAASVGFYEVCEALIQRHGGQVTVWPVTEQISVTLNPSGRVLELPQHHNPVELAELYGHTQIAAILGAAHHALAYGNGG